MKLSRFLPVLTWLPCYNRAFLARDLLAAVIVTVMLIPQSLAYAMLAGLPPQMGLYASILPLVLYAVFGSSRTLSVGPVAITALMAAAALGQLFEPGSADMVGGAILLTAMTGLMLLVMGVCRLGFLANFLSHPVISGFITASGLVIVASQLGPVLGIQAGGQNLYEVAMALVRHRDELHGLTLAIGGGVLLALLAARRYLKPLLTGLGVGSRLADNLARIAPVLAVAVTTAVTWALGLDRAGVAVVGDVPSGLPELVMPAADLSLWRQLAISAVLISIVSFVESVSIAQTQAARRRERIDPDQELVGLGASNLVSGMSGGMPVAGSFSRSAVNVDAGAETPAAGALAALGVALATVFLTPAIALLPVATLAATIIVSVLSLIDLPALVRTWRYSRADFVAMLATISLTLGYSVEAGILAGVGLSIGLFLYRTSRPHSAVVGRVPGTEHFRNVRRHQVETRAHLAMLRVDESLYFANARFLEDRVLELVSSQPELTDIVLVCPAVNLIDASALESLEAINERLEAGGVRFHLSEVKGPVMDRLEGTRFLERLTGHIFLTSYQAWQALGTGSRMAAQEPLTGDVCKNA